MLNINNPTEFHEMVDDGQYHLLTGVDFGTEQNLNGCWQDYGPNAMYVVIDGTTFAFIEDPSDGYRSSLSEVIVSNHKVHNTFEPVLVQIKTNENQNYVYDIVANGQIVVQGGTDYSDDWYPSYVAYFEARNLPQNQTGTIQAIQG